MTMRICNPLKFLNQGAKLVFFAYVSNLLAKVFCFAYKFSAFLKNNYLTFV